ncbi:MAG: DUF2341 domain-containing protein [Candidatus Eisenbacteria sp.]|nr:DUF2341 domain-containing protein [Candidatus Eisenbacteria bacterium]
MRRLLALLLAGAVPIAAGPASAQEWSFERPITIAGSDMDILDYQVRVVLSYDPDMKTDFGDLRFFAATGEPLDYWLESYDPGVEARLLVWVPSIPTSGTTIYLRYGNPTATSSSDPTHTLVYCEHFAGNLFPPYEVFKCGGLDEAMGWITWSAASECLEIKNTDNRKVCMDRDIELGTGVYAKIRYRKVRHYAEGAGCGVYFLGSDGNSYSIHFSGSYYNDTGVAKRISGQTQSKRSGSWFNDNGWYTFETYITPERLRLDINGTTRKTMSAVDTTAFDINSLSFYYRQVDIDFASLEIRRYVEPEPVAGVGDEYARWTTWTELPAGQHSLPGGRYILFAPPVTQPPAGRISELFEGLGAPGSHSWQAYIYDGTGYIENPVAIAGAAYWFFAAHESALQMRGREVGAATEILLTAGWNMMGWPPAYEVPFPWASCTVQSEEGEKAFGDSSAAVRPYVHWFADSSADWTNNGEWITQDPSSWNTSGNPWRGYFVFATEECVFRFPGDARAMRTETPGPRWPLGENPPGMGSGGWTLSFQAGGAAASDSVEVGARTGAHAGYDIWDVEKPPLVGGADVRLAIYDAARPWPEFRRDVCGPDDGEYAWTLRVSGDAEVATLNWSGGHEIPPAAHAYLIDRRNSRAVELRTAGEYEFLLAGTPREFQVVISPEAWEGELHVACQTGFELVAPNPSSGPLVVSFSIAHPGPARIDLLSVDGRHAAGVWREVVDPGRFSITCPRARDLETGVYFLRLQAAGGAETRRILIIR